MLSNRKTENNQEASTDKSRISPPSITLPKGGGAIRGIGEKFAANPVTGTGSMTVLIATSPGRSGFGPQLSLSYDSGSGNGPFGLGWNLSLPAITRKTDKGLPKYQGVTTEVLFTREDVVICPPASPLARESVVSLAQVSPYPLLALSRGSTSRQLLEAAFQQIGVPMQVAMNLGSIEVMKRFVAIGLGLAIVPRVAVAEEARTGQVVAIPIHGLPIREIGLVERTGKRRSAATTAFLQLLRAYITRHPRGEP